VGIWMCCSGSEHRTLHVLGMHMFVCVPQRLVIWMCCSGSEHRTLHVLGMHMFVVMPHRMVICMCCSGPGHRTLHVRGVHWLVAVPHLVVIWMCCSGPDHRVLQRMAKTNRVTTSQSTWVVALLHSRPCTYDKHRTQQQRVNKRNCEEDSIRRVACNKRRF
jgi:hypothetical protein